MQNRGRISITNQIDWSVVFIYLAMLFLGWLSIYASLYDETHANIFDLSQRYGIQFIWIGVSIVVATFIMLIDDKYFHMFAYPAYALSLLLLITTLIPNVGREINGAQSWLIIGPFSLQPAEFAKFATALTIARYMSAHKFNIHNPQHVIIAGLLLLIPICIIMLQNDTGSAIVFTAFSVVLYREGLSGWWFLAIFVIGLFFILSFLLQPLVVLLLLMITCLAGAGLINNVWKDKIIYAAGIIMASLILYVLLPVIGIGTSLRNIMVALIIVSMPFAILHSYRNRQNGTHLFAIFFIVTFLIILSADYLFENVLQIHQQKRILDLLGIESDPRHWGYNVNQSKIAIGSGGLIGKGFLQGTQTKFNFVPEQSTDFIFCTVGEEWGFVGAIVVLTLFAVLILKLMHMGERQLEPFGRIYCYGVAAVFCTHVIINIGMTIGIMPVIGIPLPFFSYGGSSLLAFTILLFIAVRLDAKRNRRI